MRKESSASLRLRSVTDRQSHSGIAFIGSPSDPFHFIIRCPVHIYCVIKRSLEMWEDPIKCSFYSGTMPITDLALPHFCGTFIYRNKDGKKKRFQAAFIFPLDLNVDIDFRQIIKILQSFEYAKFEYFDKKDRSLCAILGTFAPVDSLFRGLVALENLESPFCCNEADGN